jgi:hypothetical protein
MNAILNRLKEPSSYAGLAMLCSLFGYHISSDMIAQVSQGISALFAIIAIVRPESTPKP